MPTDEQLLARFVDGDALAFSELVTRHRDRVYAICLRFFRNTQDAQDATQDAFVALHRGAATFGGNARFTTWMYRVTTNVCHDIVRKRERRPRQVGFDPEWLGDTARDDVGQLELGLDLTEALKKLTPAHREAVVMHAVQGFTYVEIAERTGAAVGTIKSRVHRGLAHLAQAMPTHNPMQPSGPPVPPSPDRPRNP